jgi:uncharacterized protein YbjT (DUF2867 family)
MNPTPLSKLILLTGATGYVGGRLLKVLLEKSCRVRCMARKPEYLRAKLPPSVEVVAGDVGQSDSLGPALEGVQTAYYLVHSMNNNPDYEEADRRAAENFGRAAKSAGVQKIIYLGGLGSAGNLSPHLRSRQEVGQILRDSGVTTVEFQASIIIGSGSFSFEMIRALVERLPVMVTPRWVQTLCQPIAIDDVISYLSEALDKDFPQSRVFPIGGMKAVSYGNLMREYARQRGLRRFMIPVPFLTPRLSSLWLGLVTPVYAQVGRQLIEGLRYETVVGDPSALAVFSVKPLGVGEAIHQALGNEDHDFAQTRWSDAFSSSPAKTEAPAFGNRIVDSRTLHVDAPPALTFVPIERIGGARGWYYANFLWYLRGFMDLWVGGVGMRRGRKNPEKLQAGDTVDFWRVERVEAPHLLRLKAEMVLPGRAWLQFEVTPDGSGSLIRQTAIFDPSGLAGQLYWYLLYPIHQLIFNGMLRGVASRL